MSYQDTSKIKKEEDKLLIAKIEDKINFCITRNKIISTDFMQLNEKSVIQKYLKEEKITKYFFFGGLENADRESLILYPEKLTEEMARKNLSNLFEVITIKLPQEQNYEHREFLSGIMKLGVKREKFGDIIVREHGADIIVTKEISDYLLSNLKELTRFQKATIEQRKIEELQSKEQIFEEQILIVSSIRLDNFVAEFAKCSRSKASELLKEGKVFVNMLKEEKESKKLFEGDIITIRGKGKFIFDSIERKTKNDKYAVKIKKYQ